MGEYVYKAKVEKFLDGKIGFYDFWYKPYTGWDIPNWQKRFEGLIDHYRDNHPEGVQYCAFYPKNWDTQKWDKNRKMVVFKVPKYLSVVTSDYSRDFEQSFIIENAVGVVWGAKGGKKHFSTRWDDFLEAAREEYGPLNGATMDMLKAKWPKEGRDYSQDKEIVNVIKKSYPFLEYVRIAEAFKPSMGWVKMPSLLVSKTFLREIQACGFETLNLEVREFDGYVRRPDYKLDELLPV
jgi:hypothetical protein